MNHNPNRDGSPHIVALEGRLNKAINWLTRSGIVNGDPSQSDTFGSVNSYFDTARRVYAYAYSEITGYALTTFSYLYHLYRDEIFLELANNASKWLKEKAFENRLGGCLCRYDHNVRDFMPRRVCSFDNGMILNGLVSVYRITRDPDLIELARKIADWLVCDMQNEDGTFNVRYVYTRDRPRISNTYDKWSSQSGAFLCKIAIGLLNLYDISGEQLYKEAAIRSGDAALKFQRNDGRFITNLLQEHTHLHPHSYACEGLLALGNYLHNREYIESAMRGVEWSLRIMNPSYGFPSLYSPHKISRQERNDINAQVIRLLILSKLNGGGTAGLRVTKCVENMLQFQMLSSDRRIDGAFKYGFDEEKGIEAPHPNSWVTMFSVQALLMYERTLLRSEDFDYFLII